MNSITLSRESLEYRLNSQLFLLSCIDSEEEKLVKDKANMTEDEYLKTKIELEEFREDVFSEVKDCQEKLKMFSNGNKKIVLKQEGFKKGGQSW